MSFAFVCHHSTFIVFTSLKDPTPHRWAIVSKISVGFSFVISLTLALSGYLSFFSKVTNQMCYEKDKLEANHNF